MTLKNYLKHSGLWIGLVFNPYHWDFKLDVNPKHHIDNYIFYFEISLGLVWLKVIVDDGSW